MNYNTRWMLERLLNTLKSDFEPDVWNIYLADNDSPDDSAEWIQKNIHSYPNVKAVCYNSNIGYSAAINELALLSNSEFLCAVNADTWFTTNHVKQVIKSFESHPNAAVIGVKQMNEQGAIKHGGIFWDGVTNPIHRGWNQSDPEDKLFKSAEKCWTVSGSIYYMRRSVWNEVANFKPFTDLFPDLQPGEAWLPTPMYFEETFFSQMVQHLGYEVWYDGTIETAGHTWNASTGESHNEVSHRLFQRSRNMYIYACEKLGIEHECK